MSLIKLKAYDLIVRSRTLISTGKEIVTAVSELKGKPRTRDYITAGAKVLDTIFQSDLVGGLQESNFEPFYHSNDIFRDFFANLVDGWEKKPLSSNKENRFWLSTLYDNQIIIEVTPYGITFSRPRESELSNKKYTQLLAQKVWETCGPRLLVNISSSSNGGTKVNIEAAPASEVYQSEVVDQICDRLLPFIRNNVPRTVFLYGPPGTGKTVLLNAVSAEIRGPTILIEQGSYAYGATTHLQRLVRLLQPSGIIINDFDRISHSDDFLSFLETQRDVIKFIGASANNINGLSKAILRPGRFDDIIKIETLGLSVVKDIVGKYLPDESYLDQVINWPAACLQDLAKRMKFLGMEHFQREFDDVKRRVAFNNPSAEDKEKTAEQLLESTPPKLTGGSAILETNLKVSNEVEVTPSTLQEG